MFPKKDLAQLVIAACEHFGVDTVVISPGSRNAPLTIGFANHKKIKALSLVDERCAAFFALGIAQQKQKPVAIICTSGSAVLNYYPAIAEAFYSNIPLIVISADRPKHLIDIGDGQTINQEHVFEKHILFSANFTDGENLNDATSKIVHQQNTQLISEAFQVAISQKGPVHLNVPFDEPLYDTVPKMNKFDFPKINTSFLDNTHIDYLKYAKIWNKATKKIILVGVNYPNQKLHDLMDIFAADESVLLLTETTSNLHHKKSINSIDQLIFTFTEADFEAFKPEILVTFGGMIISKRIKKFFRAYQPKHHWHIDEKKAMNTFFCLSEFIQTNPIDFFTKFTKKIKPVTSTYQNTYLQLRDIKRSKHQEYLSSAQHADLKVFEQFLTVIPNQYQVHFSNSAIIRYAQLFTINKTLEIYCNRGTSGIDGSTSTAIGAAFASKKPVTLVTGDLSFFYDSNALWNNYIPHNFRIILVNNSGGGIFKIIPGPKKTNTLPFFETPHCLTAEHLAKMFNFTYQKAFTTAEAQHQLLHFFEEADHPKILEVFTPSNANDEVLKNYFNYLA